MAWLYRFSQFVCCGLIAAILVLPLAQMNLDLFKRKGLINVTVDRKKPVFSFEKFFDGSFQRRVDTWFMQTCGVWGYLVTTHNQISYQYFRQIASIYGNNNSIAVGNDYNLFQMLYLRDYNGDIKFDQKKLRRLVKRIKLLQDHQAALGKAVIVLVSANKLMLYPEIIPERFKKHVTQRGQRAIELFSQYANTFGLNWIHSDPILEQSKTSSNFQLFARPAAHWNSLAACKVAETLMHKIDELLPQPINTIKCSDNYKISPVPRGADHDLAQVINVWNPSPSFSETPYTEAELVKKNNARSLNMLYVGTSFLWSIFDILEPIRSYTQRDFYYYGSTNHFSFIPLDGKPKRGSARVSYRAIDWDKDVFNKDVIVLEVNEARLSQIGFAFLQASFDELRRRKKVAGGHKKKRAKLN